ncbi:DsbA family protein [Aureibacter tunicatorum]|uniref:DSBA-like thioredoxin domain-containing protein n=1 Tax=Aureibacter tunicatorum TaxID=866807 RepID=A0AAE3XQZ1_9BACT|nr:DsbA family protein [Aureibacter tunicatorum]MDR6239809.1 putative protein-disulfide isomerase [Aureibacter tunicatorum]BDD04284.1 DsbA family protein [Aureibacter tunicatorum]
MKLIFGVLVKCISVLAIMLATQKVYGVKGEEIMGKEKLIYVMDPQCGWCYGNAENIKELESRLDGKYELQLMLGGMWLGNNAPRGGEGLNQFIKQHSPRMESVTGAYVSEKFYELTSDSSYVFSSLEPSAAILAVMKIAPEKTLEFTGKVQKAMFADGLRLDQEVVYLNILQELSIDEGEFRELWLSEGNIENLNEMFQHSGSMVSGFPTLIKYSNGVYTDVASGYFDLKKIVRILGL